MRSFSQTALRTRRLKLRPLEPGGDAALFAIFSDPTVMRYWSTPPWASVDVALSTIVCDREAMATGTHLRLAIVSPADDAVLGTCMLFNLVPACRRAEIGYALARRAWGRGYIQEAATALLGYGFHELELNRVEADIDLRNTASATSLQRLGFKQEGLLRERWIVGDEVSDSALYGLLRSEWLGKGLESDA
jgi:RimJ/RimL family protein N-acetyltransferase